MKDLNDFVTGNTLTAADFVIPMSEVQNVVEGTGQTLSAGDLDQLGKGIANYVANGTFCTDSGAADAYVLTGIGSKQAPTAYTDGMKIEFVSGNDNTGASTVNAYGLGVKNIKLSGGTDPAAGDISGRTELIYDSGNNWFEIVNPKFTVSGALISKLSDQAIPNNTETAISWNSEVYDTNSYHDNATNNTRITVSDTGSYRVVANILFDTNSTGLRNAEIKKNGAVFIGAPRSQQMGVTGGGSYLNLSSAVLKLTQSDYIEVFVRQASGGNLDIVSGEHTWFSIERVFI